ncbi:hypothetical protein PAXRUDRAFT_787959 [Paxillus rubicundulus Ve08.2h10]|uniref:6-phosphogluconate dehydrogenase NADP-binding domain-containing protein n=1 Tax=Paxillus rubicundulus Ve08.2h10 TaxID=930991 RepID=A0A0D0E9K4_9AGAM|nr:hypothetical protein PAXRUDRAFT_787959 [Paxillus rubicundulus Ve08.2h10]
MLPFSRPPTPRLQPPQIGYYGLGAMGYAMARNLALSVKSQGVASPPLLVYNRTVSKAQTLRQDVGDSAVRVASSPAQLVTECDIIFTNLSHDAVVMAVYNEFAKALKQESPTKRKIFVDFSTIYPGLAGDIDKLLSGIPHCHFVASPVVGPPAAATNGGLIVLMSGDYAAKKEVAYLLVPAIGRKVIDVGGNAEQAHTLKLLGNMMITGGNELLAEVQTLGQKSGVGARVVQDLIGDIMPAPSLLIFGEKMVNDGFGEVGYDLDGCIGVTNHMRRLSAEHSCPMPVVDIAHQRLVTARSIHEAQKLVGTNKWETMDWSAMIAGSRVAAGLDPFNSSRGAKVVRDD